MTAKPPPWADLLLTVWVLAVAVIFFGVYLDPRLGRWTDPASAFYVLMVLAAAVWIAVKYLRRSDAADTETDDKNVRTKKEETL